MKEKSPLKIFYLISSRGWGGMEMHPFAVARGLIQRGHSVAFGLSAGSRMSRYAQASGFPHLALPFRWYFDPSTYAKIRQYLRDRQVDVLHVHYSRDTWHALVLAGLFRRKIPFVFTRHMGSPTKWPKTDPLHRLLTRRLDAMVAISDYIRKNCFRLYRISEGKVRLLYYGLGSEVVGQPEKGREIREKLGVQPEELLVGMVAQISRDKRQDLLLQAAGRVLAEFPETKFVFAGAPTNQEYEDKLRATAEQSGLAGRVLFTGFWEDIPSLMQALDIAVLPSRGEAFGLVMIEAMANGRVFVGSRSGAIPEVVEHGRNGLLFEPGDPEDLARALIELLRDPTKRSRMGTEARKTFEERFTLDREIRETVELYRSLIR